MNNEKKAEDMVHVTYPTAGVWLESGFYKLDDLKQFIAALETMNARNKELLK